MLKRNITYEDFNGDTVTETYYFHLSEAELIEMEVEYEEGLGTLLDNAIKAKNNKTLYEQFKKIILFSYGKKSDDGRLFTKSPEMRAEFEQTAAFQQLVKEFVFDDKEAAAFILGVIPRDIAGKASSEIASAAPSVGQTAE